MDLILYRCVLIIALLVSKIEANLFSKNEFDYNLYEEALDSEECERQLTYISTSDSRIQFQFIDAGPRTPRGILLGNLRDMGSYYECLDISRQAQDMAIEGKYCVAQIPLVQEAELPSLLQIGSEYPWSSALIKAISESKRLLDDDVVKNLQTFEIRKRATQALVGQLTEKQLSRIAADNELPSINLELAICIPKVCTSKQTMDILTFNLTSALTIRDEFCRLPNDKPWVAADYVAITIFSIIGILTLLSTFYDVHHSIILEKDPKEVNKYCTLFSIYTNTKKFFTFKSTANTITCLEGIRSFGMLWVVIGHSFSSYAFIPLMNPMEIVTYTAAFSSLWITSATITVDTFFLISGLLVVYTTASKMSKMSLVKNLHLFYLLRLLRMFPILAAAILFQVSFMHWITDGPQWNMMATNVNDCRENWWVTLLYVQNYVRKLNLCLPHTWYLAIDMQLHIISPLVLFWVLGGHKRSAWIALIGSFMAVLIGSTVYNFINKFLAISTMGSPDSLRYVFDYYQNTLTRASPFFVGMIAGYILHLYRGQTVHISKTVNILLWLLAGTCTTTIIITTYFILQPDWDIQIVNDIINSFMRPIWAICIAWMVFACHHGYGGPINWVLSLHIFKIIGRLSYAIYIAHFPFIFLHKSIILSPEYFSMERALHWFQLDVNVAMMAAFTLTVLIDLPFSRLITICLTGAKPEQKKKEPNI